MTNDSDEAQVSGDDALLHEISLMREKNHFARITAEETAKETALRLECLKLAAERESDPEITVSDARKFYDFVTGKDGAEIVHADNALQERKRG